MNYKMPCSKRAEIEPLLKSVPAIALHQGFVATLEEYISYYNCLKTYDESANLSEHDAIKHLKAAGAHASALRGEYNKLWTYPPALDRLMFARIPYIDNRPSDNANALDPLTNIGEILADLERLLATAARVPPRSSPSGGRPINLRQRDFAIAYQTLARRTFGTNTPSLRRGALKRIFTIALQEIGWYSADVISLLNFVEKPIPRRKTHP